MQWIEREVLGFEKSYKWQRVIGLSSGGTVYVPAAIAGNEQAVFLCALNDGILGKRHLNHDYVPADWLAREYPKCAELCEIIIKTYT